MQNRQRTEEQLRDDLIAALSMEDLNKFSMLSEVYQCVHEIINASKRLGIQGGIKPVYAEVDYIYGSTAELRIGYNTSTVKLWQAVEEGIDGDLPYDFRQDVLKVLQKSDLGSIEVSDVLCMYMSPMRNWSYGGRRTKVPVNKLHRYSVVNLIYTMQRSFAKGTSLASTYLSNLLPESAHIKERVDIIDAIFEVCRKGIKFRRCINEITITSTPDSNVQQATVYWDVSPTACYSLVQKVLPKFESEKALSAFIKDTGIIQEYMTEPESYCKDLRPRCVFQFDKACGGWKCMKEGTILEYNENTPLSEYDDVIQRLLSRSHTESVDLQVC